MVDNIAGIGMFSQIKLKRREFVIIQVFVPNGGKWI
jgi:hypothetical protein